MTEEATPPERAIERAIAEEVIPALVRLARADFTVRVPRSFKKDTTDVMAMFVNVIAEELDRLWKERERQREGLERGVAQLTEAFASLAAGNFDARAERSEKGDPIDVLASLLNNTAGKVGEAFSEVDRHRAVLETILDSMVDGVLLLDLQRHVRRANRAAARLLGFDHALALVGLRFDGLVGPRDASFAEGLAVAVEKSPVRNRALIFRGKSGEPIALSVNVSPILASDGALEGIVVVARDDRELRRAQAQLQLSDRLATMGTLAAGVAHEINNPLAYVMSNVDFVLDTLGRTKGEALDDATHEDVMKGLRACLSGAERVRLIVRDLRAFSRIEQDTTSRIDLRRLLDSASSLIRNEVRHHATLEKDFGAVPLVDANEPRLVQVFLNLIQNAAHAIPVGDAVHQRIRLVTRTNAAGEAVVEVRDTGTGIAPENVSQVFEAFFTTKAVGVGTGLGLAICQKLVSSFGGRIELETVLGKGSTFRVLLPPASSAAPDKAPRPRIVPPKDSPQATSRRRVLVVDDEVEIGEAFALLLGARHDVVVATHGSQALQLVRASVFDVIFCDLMMPELSGIELYRQLLRELPSAAAKIVFMTGGVFGSGVEEFLASIQNECLEKPFLPSQVVALVEAAPA